MIVLTPKILFTFLLLGVLVLLTSSCSASANAFEPDKFVNDSRRVVLAFDLRNDQSPIVAIVINAPLQTQPTEFSFALPFATSDAIQTRELLSSWGSYDKSTVVRFLQPVGTQGIYSVRMVPTFDPSPESFTDIDTLSGSLYFIESGLERILIYKYPDADPNKEQWRRDYLAAVSTQIEAIAVVLPENATGKEIGRTGSTALPLPDYTENGVRFFAPTSSNPSAEDALQVRYELPPNAAQEGVAEFVGKLIIALIAPLIQILTLQPTNATNMGRRKLILRIAVGFQISLIVVYVALAALSWQGDILSISVDLLVAILAGVAIFAATIYEKRNTKAP